MKVTGLPKDPGLSGWNEILPERVPHPSLEGNVNADYLIIGAGFAGLAAARRLLQLNQKASIAVLEARTIAGGPAGRNSGFMIDLPHNLASKDYSGTHEADLQQTAMNRAAIDFAQQTAKEYEFGQEVFVRSGKVNSAASEAGQRNNRDYASHLSSLNEPHELLDAAQMKELTGTDYYFGGLFTPGTAMIQPAMYIRGLAEGLSRDGVLIHENSPVVDLVRNGRNWKAKTPAGLLTAPKVILAVNGHVESFGYFKRRLMHVFLYASMTRALDPAEAKRLGGAPRWGCTPSDPLGTTVRRISGTGGDRIIIRNRFTYSSSRQVSEARITPIAKVHMRSFAARFPMLKNVGLQYSWGGLLCLSLNAVPAYGGLDVGLYSACCQNGLGAAKGTFSGMLAAEQASGFASAHLQHVLAQDPPKRLPPEPLATIGATTLMRWREFRAGREL